MKKSDFILKCSCCDKEYSSDSVLYTCPDCGNRNGTLEVIIDFGSKCRINNQNKDFWRYLDFLPVDEEFAFRGLPVGNTPVINSSGLAEELGVKEFFIKDEGRNPTASYKDRATIMAVSKCRELGFKEIFAASTGNAASSLAGIGAAAKLNVKIFVPETAPIAKITQLMVYGAEVNRVTGTYDQAFDISLEIGFKNNWYCRNSAINPYLLEGKKTGFYELAEQLDFKIPDIIIVSVGDGTIYSSLQKASDELYELDFIDKKPVIVGVQGENTDSIKRVFENGEPFKPADIFTPSCLADSISVGKPRDYLKACKYAKKNNGFFVSVTDEEIGNAIIDLARSSGVFAEPAGAASFAGARILKKMGILNSKTSLAIFVTGNGLKDIKAPVDFIKEKSNVLKIQI